ncbi:non-ribosomal peptide synthetase [Isoptericola croceus]|uniref:non-ribosomal peptide synthetase n=1 Tax=Isoptericola croceus TaxID=3031406 RepID=UPI0023F85642|nr:non-ribosomal peptide synthetase [Isoptericola croceus]
MTEPATLTETPAVPHWLRAAVTTALPDAGRAPGDDDNLFACGLDSLTLIRLIGGWRRQGVRARFDELAADPTLRGWARIVGPSAPEAPAAAQDAEADADVVRVPDGEPYPLATMQHAYWIGRDPDQPWGGVAAHYYVELDGRGVDPERLRRALGVLVTRHGLLRTRFGDDGQAVTAPAAGPHGVPSPNAGVEVHDLRRLDDDDVTRRLDELRDRYTHQHLDIAAGHLLGVALSLLPRGRTRLHLDLDMVAADALSMRLLLADLRAAYLDPDAVAARPLPRLGFADYLATERRDRADDRQADAEYWHGRLDTLPDGPQLPAAAAATGPARSRRLHHWLTPEQVATLGRRAAEHGVTPSALLATVFAETVGAWSRQGRFLLNLPLFDRDEIHPDVNALVGDFSSSILLEIDLRRPAGLVDRARALAENLAEAVAHGSYPGVEVLRDKARHEGTPVLAPVVYTSAIGLGELYEQAVCETFGEPSWIISQGPQVWLDAQVTEFRGGLLVNWDVRDDVLRDGVADAAFDYYRSLLDDLLTAPEAWHRPAPSELPPAQRQVRDRVNDTAVDHRPQLLHATVADLDPAWAYRVAVADSRGTLTYAELAAASGAVAGWLRARGVGAGDTVAVSLPKGRAQVVAVLGILRAGATYLPISIDQPAARAATMRRLGDVVTTIDAATYDDAVAFVPPDGADAAAPGAGQDDEPAGDESDDDLAAQVRRPAYVLFTSGSTGEPKGVEVSHAAAMNTVAALNRRLDLGPHDASLALSALEFDLSVYDMFAPLAVGGTVVVVTEEERRDPEAWWRLITQHHVTVWNSVPALLGLLLAAAPSGAGASAGEGPSLRAALLGGDVIPTDLPDRFHAVAPRARFLALGGMTEAAIHSTVAEIGSPAGAMPDGVPWGVPLDNVRCRVVDDRGHDCRDQVVGELWMGGAGLAEGYRGRPDATAERFVTLDGERWYRTGDLASYRPDGTLVFHGRRDAQVQVLGHRIEPGEVESALRALPGVRDAVVRAVHRRGATRLAAVVAAADPAPSADELRSGLSAAVPAYMVCDPVVVVPELPLSANGKVVGSAVEALVRAALDGGATADGAASGGGAPPRTASERRVAQVWAELLRPPRPLRTGDDFFSLGGDSLLATRATAALRRAGAEGARVSALLRATSLAEYAASLTWPHGPDGVEAADDAVGAGPSEAQVIVPRPDERHLPFPGTDVQQAYLLGRDPALPLGGVGTWQYAEFDAPAGGSFDVAAIESAWRRLVARHEMLRTSVDADGMLTIHPELPRWELPVRDVGSADELERLRQAWSHRVLDLSQPPLWHVELVRHPHGERWVIGLDYIVFDALSIMTLFTELDLLVTDSGAHLAPIELSFRDYVLQHRADPAAVDTDQQYWRERLAQLPPGPTVPLARTVDEAPPRFERRQHRLDAESWQRLQDLARRLRLTPSTVLLALYAHVLGRWSERGDVTVTLTMFNRREVHPDIYRVLGDFTTVSLADYRPSEADDWQQAASALQARLAEDLDHREVSSSWLLRELTRMNGRLESVPVVFTSGLGVGTGPGVGMDMSPAFGTRAYGISQSPQVTLDNQVTESEGGLLITWDSVVGLFADGVVDAMFELYRDAVTACTRGDVAAAGRVLDGLPAGQRAVRDRVNDTATARTPRTLHGAVLDGPDQQRDGVALRGADGSEISHRRLRSVVLEHAGALRDRGVRPGDRVGVRMPKSPDQVVAVLAVLAAGGVYVPIGVDQPAARVARIAAAAGLVHTIDGLEDLSGAEPLAEPWAGDPHDVAYVIFTSGSTGEPKGVEITHAAAANTIDDLVERCGLTADDVVLGSAALDFDLSVFDIFGTLAVGAELVVPSESDRRDADRWCELVRTHRVTWWNSVPLLYDLLLGAAERQGPGRPLESLRQVLLSGDWVGLDLAERSSARAPHARLLALGGATEAAIWSNAQPFDRAEPHWPSVPYGRPLSNQEFRVVDDLRRDRPDRAVGELWIGGAGLARGYCGDPALTDERFVVDGGRRWYRTGDLGRYWPDGTLEFCGRRDAQVKVGGHRVELGEVEAALERLPRVERAAAVLAGDRSRVFALVTGSGPLESGRDEAGLREMLRAELPPYAVPARVVRADEMPLTVNGKLDRAAVASLVAAHVADHAGAERAAVESAGLAGEVARLWAEVGVVVRDDQENFFAAGGNSLAALRFVQAVERRWGADYTVRAFLQEPTVASVAAELARRGADQIEEGVL